VANTREADVGNTRNSYRVPASQWRKWQPPARVTFNYMYTLMRDNPSLFQHPKHPLHPKTVRTAAWNTAWMAADCVRDALKVT